jgi:hypothetical protein
VLGRKTFATNLYGEMSQCRRMGRLIGGYFIFVAQDRRWTFFDFGQTNISGK